MVLSSNWLPWDSDTEMPGPALIVILLPSTTLPLDGASVSANTSMTTPPPLLAENVFPTATLLDAPSSHSPAPLEPLISLAVIVLQVGALHVHAVERADRDGVGPHDVAIAAVEHRDAVAVAGERDAAGEVVVAQDVVVGVDEPDAGDLVGHQRQVGDDVGARSGVEQDADIEPFDVAVAHDDAVTPVVEDAGTLADAVDRVTVEVDDDSRRRPRRDRSPGSRTGRW